MSELTFEEKTMMEKAIDEYCNAQTDCTDCLLKGVCHIESVFDLTKAYNILFPPSPVEETPPGTHDVINHPSHYCREGAMESIDEMVLLFGKEVVKHFCLCNIWKYRYRSNAKNGEEDVKKSDWYVQKYKELCE